MKTEKAFYNWRKESEVRGKTYEPTDQGYHQCVVDALQASEEHPRTVIILTGLIRGKKKVINTFLNGLMSPEDTVRIQNELDNGKETANDVAEAV